MEQSPIYLSIPNLIGNERKYLMECVDTNFVSSVGPFVSRFEEEFAKYHQVKKAVATVNGTAALHIALILAGVTSEHEVLVPNLTFIAPLNALKYVGAHPILVDVKEESFGLHVEKLEEFLKKNASLKNGKCVNKKTKRVIKAVVPVHIFGFCVDMDPLLKLAKKYRLTVIEDASESLGTTYKNKLVGTLGDFGCFSFNGNKIVTSGGGGMIIGKSEKRLVRAKHLTTTAKVNDIHFAHNEVGYNYRMVNPLAAIGLAQFENLDKFIEIKRKNFLKYENLISSSDVELMKEPSHVRSNYWLYCLKIKKKKKIDDVIRYFANANVQVRPVWKLMEDIPMFKKCQKTNTDISKKLRKTIINIPCSTGIKDSEIERVAELIKGI